MSIRPITDAELKTLDQMAKDGDLELSERQIGYRNARYAQAVPLLLEKIATLRAQLEEYRQVTAQRCADISALYRDGHDDESDTRNDAENIRYDIAKEFGL